MTDRPEGKPEPELELEPVDDEGDEEVDANDEDTDDEEPDKGDAGDAGDEPDDTDAPSEAETESEAAPAGAVPPATRRRGETKPTNRAPTPSELAVHVNEPWSKVFVIVTVVVFVAILLNGFLLGKGGLTTGTPTPRPTASATVAPSASASAGASIAPSGSPAP